MLEQTPNIDINQTSETICDECQGVFFQQVLSIRRASGLLTGTGKTSYIPIPVFACISCNHVNTEFLPKEIQSL
tara:strand:+ start:99 stop:320 length:222 start_codon:yes stop_codon:yes gene_type:complete